MIDDHADAAWERQLEDLFLRIGHRFGRADLRRRGRDCIRGLLAPVGRKNGWQLAEFAGHRTPDGLQRLLNRANWDADDVRDDLQGYVAEHLGEGAGVLVVDDTGFVKKGITSAGVQRQYSGTAGRTENCQIGVFAAYATTRGRALVDRELHLPKSRTDDRDRCRAAKVPDERGFATKGELAKRLVLRALASELPIAWVTADAAYGQEGRFRRLLEQSGIGYVLAVPKSQQVFGPRIDHLFAPAPNEAWETMSCREGAKGPRLYHWAAVELPTVPEFDHQGRVPVRRRWALARRSLRRPEEIAYFLACTPLDIAVEEMVRVAGMRWQIEECFQAAKNEPGPVRSPPIRGLVPAHHVGDAGPRLSGSHDPRGKGGAETVPAPWFHSPWQKSAGSWRSASPQAAPAGRFAATC